jgi:coenzyme F420-reducing hydrogenase delta subunit
MCSGRVDLGLILRAFANGADGVFVGGCWPGECHYLTEGNYDALSTMYLGRRLMGLIGVDGRRLRLEWMSAAEGNRFAEVMDDFVRQLKELGPLDGGERAGGNGWPRKLEALRRLIPYLKLVEREKLCVRERSEEAYARLYASPEVDRLFQGLIADKLAIGQIALLLDEEARSIGDLSQALGCERSEVSRLLSAGSRMGLLGYDAERNRYHLTRTESELR